MAATAPKMIDGLELNQATAKKIVKIGIEVEAYSDDMPDTKKAQIEAAHEIVALCWDVWVNDGVRPDDDDDEVVEAANAALKVFKAAGITVDDDGDLELPGSDDDDDDDDDEGDDDSEAGDDASEGDDDDEAFDPDSYFEDGWSELTAKTKISVLDELDLEDEDNQAAVAAVYEWEKAQDKPASRVLSWVEERFDMDDDDEGDSDDDDDESESAEDTDESEGGEAEEPWDGYNEATAKVICDTLKEQDEITVEQLQYVKEYEEAMDRPRKRVVDLCAKMIAELEDGDDEEEKPKPKSRIGKGSKKSADPDENDEVDEAVERDNDKERGKKVHVQQEGTITLTREMILEALDTGRVYIEL